MAVGATVRITTLPGYLPIRSDPAFLEVYRANAEALVGAENVVRLRHRTGSTDMGDVSHLMPVIHPYVVAATGTGHGSDYLVQDYQLGVITGAKAMAMTVVDLLADGARVARDVLAKSRPPLTKESYLALQEGRMREERYRPE